MNLHDEIDLPIVAGAGSGFGIVTHAIADADLFSVSDQTGWGFADAEAISQLWFSPVQDQSQTVNIQISAWGRYTDADAYTAGQITLLDLTTDSTLWSYGWNYGGSQDLPDADTIPWDANSNNTAANFSLDTDFLASHQYELTMIASSEAGDDSESVQIHLAGLQAVPEPSSILLFAVCGLAPILFCRRK